MPEAPAVRPLSLAEALAWMRFDVDADGSRVGRVDGVYVDAESGEPAWLVVSMGRRGAKKVVVPVRECAGAGGRVWTAQSRAALRAAPTVDPARPLLREHEEALCSHYGIGPAVGRHGELARRPEAAVTARPA